MESATYQLLRIASAFYAEEGQVLDDSSGKAALTISCDERGDLLRFATPHDAECHTCYIGELPPRIASSILLASDWLRAGLIQFQTRCGALMRLTNTTFLLEFGQEF